MLALPGACPLIQLLGTALSAWVLPSLEYVWQTAVLIFREAKHREANPIVTLKKQRSREKVTGTTSRCSCLNQIEDISAGSLVVAPGFSRFRSKSSKSLSGFPGTVRMESENTPRHSTETAKNSLHSLSAEFSRKTGFRCKER
jgi:hypothetical protein